LTGKQPTEKISAQQNTAALRWDLRSESQFLLKENPDGLQDKAEEEKEVVQSYHP
jgi:hypothetical protein